MMKTIQAQQEAFNRAMAELTEARTKDEKMFIAGRISGMADCLYLNDIISMYEYGRTTAFYRDIIFPIPDKE